MSKIKKAVFPVAVSGTRFLPATKDMPKELLPIIDKPLIQYAAEEAVQAGIDTLIFITGRNKRAVEDHFDNNQELEMALRSKGKNKQADMVRNILPEGIECLFVRQPAPLGLGHAVLCAKRDVGNDPFAVLLGDTICTGNPNCTKGLVQVFREKKECVFAVEEVLPRETKRYGIISGQEVSSGLRLVDKLVEKPEPEVAPSLLGIQGRYIFTPEIFTYQKDTVAGSGGEIQLTDAMQLLADNSKIYSWTFPGKRYDIGTMKDWFKSHIELSAESDFKHVIEEIINKS